MKKMENKQKIDEVKLKTVGNPWKRVKSNETEELFKNVTGILNKLTPEKFDILIAQFLSLPINTEERIVGVVDIIFNKAASEPIYSAVYANMCKVSFGIEVQKKVNGKEENVNFRDLMLSKCKTTFLNGNQDYFSCDIEEIAKCTNPDQRKELESFLHDKERMFRKGNVRFIGELFKLGLLDESIIVQFIVHLLEDPQEMPLECLAVLLTTIGKTLEHAPSQVRSKVLDKHFERISELAEKKEGSNLSTRIRFMMQDLLELRLNKWVPRRKAIVPKTIEEINKEIECESLEMSITLNGHSKRGN